jgi:nickel/cobalt transporter (NicO) family protein
VNRRHLPATLLLAALAVALTPAAAAAHPLGNFTTNQYAGLRVTATGVDVDFVLDLAELPAYQARHDEIDTDGSGTVAGPESDRYAASTCAAVGAATTVTIDGRVAAVAARPVALTFPPGAGGLTTLRLQCVLHADARPVADTTVGFRDDYLPDRIGWREVTAVGDHYTLTRSTVPAASPSKRLTAYPAGAPTADTRTASLTVRPGGPAAAPFAGSAAFAPPARGADRLTRWFTGLVGHPRLTWGVGILAFLVAFVLGGAHAVAPGHGKTIMAAYLVGARGRLTQALTVAATVAATHTLGVLALGVVLATSLELAPQHLYAWLQTASGVLVAAVGAQLLRGALRATRARRAGMADTHSQAAGGSLAAVGHASASVAGSGYAHAGVSHSEHTQGGVGHSEHTHAGISHNEHTHAGISHNEHTHAGITQGEHSPYADFTQSEHAHAGVTLSEHNHAYLEDPIAGTGRVHINVHGGGEHSHRPGSVEHLHPPHADGADIVGPATANNSHDADATVGHDHGSHPTGGHGHGDHPTDGHSHGDHPTGGHSHGDHPTDGHSHGDHPTDGHSHGDHPTDGHSHGDHPASGHSHGDHPTDGHSHGDHPASGHSHGDHPTDGHSHGDHPTGGHSHGDHLAHRHTATGHAHAPGDLAVLEHGHDHPAGPHSHGGGRPHTHHLPAPDEPFRVRTLLAMGFAGGLSPSPSAVVVLLGAAALGRAWYGVLLVLAYGIGLAAVLTGIGLALARWGERLRAVGSGRLARLLAHRLPAVTAAVILAVGIVMAALAISSLFTTTG